MRSYSGIDRAARVVFVGFDRGDVEIDELECVHRGLAGTRAQHRGGAHSRLPLGHPEQRRVALEDLGMPHETFARHRR